MKTIAFVQKCATVRQAERDDQTKLFYSCPYKPNFKCALTVRFVSKTSVSTGSHSKYRLERGWFTKMQYAVNWQPSNGRFRDILDGKSANKLRERGTVSIQSSPSISAAVRLTWQKSARRQLFSFGWGPRFDSEHRRRGCIFRYSCEEGLANLGRECLLAALGAL